MYKNNEKYNNKNGDKKNGKNGTSKKKNKKRYCVFINEQGNIK